MPSKGWLSPPRPWLAEHQLCFPSASFLRFALPENSSYHHQFRNGPLSVVARLVSAFGILCHPNRDTSPPPPPPHPFPPANANSTGHASIPLPERFFFRGRPVHRCAAFGLNQARPHAGGPLTRLSHPGGWPSRAGLKSGIPFPLCIAPYVRNTRSGELCFNDGGETFYKQS